MHHAAFYSRTLLPHCTRIHAVSSPAIQRTYLVIGYDHRFGHNRSEGFEDYCRYGEELHIKVVQAQALTEENISISSSVIRALLKEGNITQANHYLGYSYYLDGTVVNGYKVGRKLGFPTANLLPSCPDKLIPAEGVYAVYTYIEDNGTKECSISAADQQFIMEQTVP